MKLSANMESVQALHDLGAAMPLVLANLENESSKFLTLVADLEEGLGERFSFFEELAFNCVLAVQNVQNPIEDLARELDYTAEQLELYLRKGHMIVTCAPNAMDSISRTMNTPEELAILREIDIEDDTGSVRVDIQMREPQPKAKHLPTEASGKFVGAVGDSLFIPHDPSAIEYLNCHGHQGVEYRGGYPDFSPFAQISTPWGDVNSRVDIGHMTSFRRNPPWDFGKRTKDQAYDLACDLGNFNQADISLAEKLCSMNAELANVKGSDLCRDIATYRKERKLTWHECADGHTMLLIPAVIHKACPHSGGVSFERLRAAYGNVALNIPEEI